MVVSAKRVVVTSFLVDFLDLLTSVVVAFLSGSVVMLAQALEGGADLISSGLLLFGLNRSLKISDKDHPFGHGRELYFWTLISALFTLSVSAGLSLYFGWHRFINPTPIKDLFLANLVLFITVLTNGYALALSIKRLVGKSSQTVGLAFFTSPLIETRATFVLDLMGTLASLIGLGALSIYYFSGDLRFDGLGAMAIGVTLAVMAVLLVLGVRDLLVGKSASPDIEEKIREATLSLVSVSGITELRTNHIGPDQILVELDVKLKTGQEGKGSEIVGEIKRSIKSAVPEVQYIQVEIK